MIVQGLRNGELDISSVLKTAQSHGEDSPHTTAMTIAISSIITMTTMVTAKWCWTPRYHRGLLGKPKLSAEAMGESIRA